jgi:hypothetical protein
LPKKGLQWFTIYNSLRPAQPISYTESARFQRAILSLEPEQRTSLVALLAEHLELKNIQSVQRRGHFIYLTVATDTGESVGIYNFGHERSAQMCLTAITDCLRVQRSPVKVLMPIAAPEPVSN